MSLPKLIDTCTHPIYKNALTIMWETLEDLAHDTRSKENEHYGSVRNWYTKAAKEAMRKIEKLGENA